MEQSQRNPHLPNSQSNKLLDVICDIRLTKCPNCDTMVESVNVTLSPAIRHLLVERRRAILIELDTIEQLLGRYPLNCDLRKDAYK